MTLSTRVFCKFAEEPKEAISHDHSLPSSGHQVVTCIKEQVKEEYTWYGFGHDVKLLVS
jgi:hypothetical protein